MLVSNTALPLLYHYNTNTDTSQQQDNTHLQRTQNSRFLDLLVAAHKLMVLER